MALAAARIPVLRKLAGGAAVGLVAGVIALLLHAVGFITAIEDKTIDWRQRRVAGSFDSAQDERGLDPQGGVAVIFQGQESLDATSPHRRGKDYAWGWPWPRSIWQPVLELTRRDGARATALDVIFSEASRSKDDDDAFVEGLSRNGAARLGVLFGGGVDDTDPGIIDRIRELAVTVTADVPADLELFPERTALHSASLEIFLRAASGIGNIGHGGDPDSVYRRLAPLIRFQGRFYPTLSLAAVHGVAGGGPLHVTAARELVFGVGTNARRIPLERDGTILIRFGRELLEAERRAVEAFDAALAGAALEGPADRPAKKATFEPGAFKDRLVFLGYSAAGTLDIKANPLMPHGGSGTLVHVALAQNLLANRVLSRWDRRGDAPLLATLLLLGMATGAVVAATPSAFRQVMSALTIGALWLGFAVLVAFPRDLVVDIIAPELSVLLALTTGSLLNYVLEGRSRARIKDAFQHYLNPVFVEQLLRDPSKLKLGGEKRELTIFFSDLAGFTTLSEKLSPEDLVRQLNEYLTRMTRIILRLGGTHDKYIGDAIMCFWNAPLDIDQHAKIACIAALEQQDEIAKLNAEWRAKGLPAVLARMGINTGQVVVGNMGSEQTMDYTVMGDSVNLASRLEGANKPFETLIMCGERTEQLARDEIDFRELAGLKVKGKYKPVKVFEVIGQRGKTPPERLERARRFEKALRLYEARSFAEAAAIFDDLANKHADGPSKIYLTECRHFEKDPPPADWDGVVTLTSK